MGWLVCKEPGEGASAGAPYFVTYVYYLSKYLELLDTWILVLKGKSLSLLHVFHHAVMPLMCWFCKPSPRPPLPSIDKPPLEPVKPTD